MLNLAHIHLMMCRTREEQISTIEVVQIAVYDLWAVRSQKPSRKRAADLVKVRPEHWTQLVEHFFGRASDTLGVANLSPVKMVELFVDTFDTLEELMGLRRLLSTTIF